MQSFIDKIRNRHNEIYIGFMLLCFMGLMLYLLPREVKFRYEYTLEGVWQHETLEAPFDFAIQKTAAEIEAEKQQLRDGNLPFYEWQPQLEEGVQSEFERGFRSAWDLARSNGALEKTQGEDSVRFAHNLAVGKGLITQVMDKGYVKWEEAHSLMEKDEDLALIRGNRAMMITPVDLFTYPSMHLFVTEALKKGEGLESNLLLESIENSLQYNVFFNANRTQQALDESLAGVLYFKDRIKQGELVIRKGARVSEDKFQILHSLQAEFEQRSLSSDKAFYIFLGQIFLLGVCLLAFVILIRISHRSLLAAPSKILAILLLIAILAIGLKAIVEGGGLHYYLAPVCIIMLTIRAFYNVVLAVFMHIIAVLLLSFLVPNQYEFVFLHFFAGILLLFGLRGLNKRSHYFNGAALIFLSYSLIYYGINVIHEGDIRAIDWGVYGWFAGNAALSLLVFPLIYVYERVFGLLSEMSLLEMADSNNVLLRELNELAPGTFQHSLQVANLAEEAIHKIGGHALLVRVGALYHDIGKMKAPGFFIENQAQGRNPHESRSNLESAKIIINHVIQGIELARKHNLPDEIIDFIRTHHGLTLTEYFYRKEVADKGEAHVNRKNFQYPGPLPFSKETAVLMMADSVEAASRSIKEVDAEKLEKLIDSIIDYQMTSGQFINADITLKEITTVKSVFKRKLKNIYHIRIEYPK